MGVSDGGFGLGWLDCGAALAERASRVTALGAGGATRHGGAPHAPATSPRLPTKSTIAELGERAAILLRCASLCCCIGSSVTHRTVVLRPWCCATRIRGAAPPEGEEA